MDIIGGITAAAAFCVGAAFGWVAAIRAFGRKVASAEARLANARRLEQTAGELRRTLGEARATYQRHLPIMHSMAQSLNMVEGPPCSCQDCEAWREGRVREEDDAALPVRRGG